jgi:hypothetical protein
MPVTFGLGDGAQYQVNSTMVENQVNYYQAAVVKLYTKYDSQADSSGSCGLITRRKDMHAPTLNGAFYRPRHRPLAAVSRRSSSSSGGKSNPAVAFAAGRAAGFSQRAAVRGGGGSGRIDLPW